ncbi:MAG: DUF885 domain-containing protein [Nitrososphaerales archaeon]
MRSNEEFDSLVENFFKWVMESDPIKATELGLHEYDDKMPQASKASKLAEISATKQFLKMFLVFKREKLTFEKAIDRDAAIYWLNLKLFYDDTLKIWQRLPNVSNTVGRAIFYLLIREYAPIEQRLNSITSRLLAIPNYINDSKNLFEDPVKLWVETEIAAVEKIPSILDATIKIAKAESYHNLNFLYENIINVKKALSEYNYWLKHKALPKAHTNFSMGEKLFAQLLKYRLLNTTAQKLLKSAKKGLAREKKLLNKWAVKISKEPVNKVIEKIKAKHPKDLSEVILSFEKSLNLTRQFVKKTDFCTIPRNEKIKVGTLPEFLKPIAPLGLYFRPAKFEKKQIGLLLITPLNGNVELLKEHNFAIIPNRAVHEGYPGHHLQFACANTNPSLVRTLLEPTEFIEGWAHYCEEELKNRGFDDTAEARLMLAVDAVWRTARVIVDVSLAVGSLSFDKAANFLIKQARMERESAIAEVVRYTQTPGYALSYYYGKQWIKKIKKKAKKVWGARYSDKLFHNTLLYSGNLPLKLMEKVINNSIA